ncbi:MAG: hypothetical protein WBW04_04440 [Nitrolancea sp.]
MMQGIYAGVQPQSENDKLISAIGYIFLLIVPIIVLVTTMKVSRFNKIHAYQGLVFFGVAVAYYILYTCAYVAITSVVGLLACVLWIGYFVPFVAGLYLAFRVYTAKQVEFPLLTQAAAAVFKDM